MWCAVPGARVNFASLSCNCRVCALSCPASVTSVSVQSVTWRNRARRHSSVLFLLEMFLVLKVPVLGIQRSASLRGKHVSSLWEMRKWLSNLRFSQLKRAVWEIAHVVMSQRAFTSPLSPIIGMAPGQMFFPRCDSTSPCSRLESPTKHRSQALAVKL